MLTKSQQKYLEQIPIYAKADIKPWDFKAALFAQNLINQIQDTCKIEVFWCGSLSLGILGQNDVDLYLFLKPEDFSKHLPNIISVLGEPTHTSENKILWRIIKNGYKVDAYLGDKSLERIQKDIFFHNSLKSNPKLLKDYIDIKNEEGLSAREYYRRKNEFYNKIVNLNNF